MLATRDRPRRGDRQNSPSAPNPARERRAPWRGDAFRGIRSPREGITCGCLRQYSSVSGSLNKTGAPPITKLKIRLFERCVLPRLPRRLNDAIYPIDMFMKNNGRGNRAKNAVELVAGSIRRARFGASWGRMTARAG